MLIRRRESKSDFVKVKVLYESESDYMNVFVVFSSLIWYFSELVTNEKIFRNWTSRQQDAKMKPA